MTGRSRERGSVQLGCEVKEDYGFLHLAAASALRWWTGQFPLRLLCWLRFGPAGAALPSEEFEGFADELCVELEDAAVAGVGVGD
jgi:hypothetical protein